MNKLSKRFLTLVLYIAIVSNLGCTTTTQRAEPSQPTMNNYATGKFDNVLVGAEIENLRRVGPSQVAMDDYGSGQADNLMVSYADKDNPRKNSNRQLKPCAILAGVAALVQLSNLTRGDLTGLVAAIELLRPR
jgi:hypothetical protein